MTENLHCPRCGKPGGFAFPPYWFHDRDTDAARCPLGNNWQLSASGDVIPYWEMPVRDGSRAPSPTCPSHDAVPSGTGPERPQKARRARARVQGDPQVLEYIQRTQYELAEALTAVAVAREARRQSVKAALEEGWSYRALAQALGVHTSWVQRVVSGD